MGWSLIGKFVRPLDFPFAAPFTNQETAVSDVLVRVAPKNVRWPT
jgi:hypothetical protein